MPRPGRRFAPADAAGLLFNTGSGYENEGRLRQQA